MSAKVTEWVWEHFQGTIEEKLVLLYLARMATDAGIVPYWNYHNTQHIAMATNIAMRQIDDILQTLSDNNHIVQETDGNDYVMQGYVKYVEHQEYVEHMLKLIEARIEHLRDSGRLSDELYDYITNKDIFR